jgi:hypothetical protein
VSKLLINKYILACLIVFFSGCSSVQPPTQEQMCSAISESLDDSNYSRDKAIKLCEQGAWKKNDSAAFDCAMYYAEIDRKVQPVVAEVKNCKKFACQPTAKENEFLCDYYQELSITNLIKPYENHFYHINNGNRKGLFTMTPQGWEYSQYSDKKKFSKGM